MVHGFNCSRNEEGIATGCEPITKTPVLDVPCNCLLNGAHTISEHGASPEWHDQHYYVTAEEMEAIQKQSAATFERNLLNGANPNCHTPACVEANYATACDVSRFCICGAASLCTPDSATVCVHGKQSTKGDGYAPMCNGAHQLKLFRFDWDGIQIVTLANIDEVDNDDCSPIVSENCERGSVPRADVVAMNIGDVIHFNEGAGGCGSITRVA